MAIFDKRDVGDLTNNPFGADAGTNVPFGADAGSTYVNVILPQWEPILGEKRKPPLGTVKHKEPNVGRNEPCPCGSGTKFKKCDCRKRLDEFWDMHVGQRS